MQNNISQTNINNRTSYPILDNQDSRDKVRGALNTIFAKLNELPIEEGGVVDVVPESIISKES